MLFRSDPTLVWATYYGGTNGNIGYSCAVDAANNVYLAGYTSSSTNIAAGGHQNTYSVGIDAFLVKFNSAGVRQWATYYGGTYDDYGYSCAVDAANNVYLAGYTQSTTNIAAGGHQDTIGRAGASNAFLVKFNSAGIRQWATYYGSTNGEYGYTCAADAANNVYLAGYTQSTTNIAAGGHQNTFGGFNDAFLVKFNSAGVRQWATYYGDTDDDLPQFCVVDAANNVYLAGYTSSNTSIAAGGHQNTFGGDNDAFLVKFNSAGVRQWATYYGGMGSDIGYTCAVDAANNVYLVGYTESTTNVAAGGHQNTIGGANDAFLDKFNSAGVRQWATYYGGTNDDYGYFCAVDAANNIYMTGSTASTTNIAAAGHQDTLGGSEDAFLAKFNSAGVRQWATYYGGTSIDRGYACAVDAANNVYLAGPTESTTNIAANGHQNTYSGGNADAFLAKFGLPCVATTATITQAACTSFSLNGTTYASSGTYTQTRMNAAGCDSTITLNLTINPAPSVSISQNNTALEATAGYTTYVWSLNGAIINGANSSSHNATANGSYQVTVTDANGCQNTASFTYTASNISQINATDFAKICPNPTDGLVNINFSQAGAKTIRIYDNLGRVVYQNQFEQAQIQISLAELPSGVYQVQIMEAQQQATQSLIIAK